MLVTIDREELDGEKGDKDWLAAVSLLCSMALPESSAENLLLLVVETKE